MKVKKKIRYRSSNGKFTTKENYLKEQKGIKKAFKKEVLSNPQKFKGNAQAEKILKQVETGRKLAEVNKTRLRDGKGKFIGKGWEQKITKIVSEKNKEIKKLNKNLPKGKKVALIDVKQYVKDNLEELKIEIAKDDSFLNSDIYHSELRVLLNESFNNFFVENELIKDSKKAKFKESLSWFLKIVYTNTNSFNLSFDVKYKTNEKGGKDIYFQIDKSFFDELLVIFNEYEKADTDEQRALIELKIFALVDKIIDGKVKGLQIADS